MPKYLVTGGAGFIGSNLVERLVCLGQEVRVVDNFSTGRFENIAKFADNIEIMEGDLSDFETARESVKGMDYILHHAAIPSVPKSIEDPIGVNRSIVTTTVNLFKAAVDVRSVKRIVQAVSAAAYGNSPELPKKEDMLPEPLSPYAVAKLTQEYYAKAFYSVYGLEVLSLRYFNVFGPKQDPHSHYAGVISIFANAISHGRKPVIFGDGLTSRDFIFVDNIVDANLAACSCKWPGNAEIINIGSGRGITLNELVNKLNIFHGTSIAPIYKEERAGDVKHSVSDISKACSILGYKVRVSMDDGLSKLLEWMKKNERTKVDCSI
jgi:UDP-glucose 4-epimerase